MSQPPVSSLCQCKLISGQDTLVEGDTQFLKNLDTGKAANALVNDEYVMNAIDNLGGISRFCDCSLTKPYTREEVVEIN